ncbi:hypothetical protein EPUS_00777 [Endocarpon pusillum Z07020]|uniref:Uncharacterized protein n=1 Tax=Endocarpon pusillum (strain Z07020 / HMAS-L-300199) TaxID=1263415 RepID=U1GAV0_ENDPU|nr:uncharacterized protein EPUS_00777 [Endocarpon pusillum Z07020]ERF74647.1 hypothetical protein EPUS_00777 [Endocarpon pusillum Z07020]
MSGKSNRGQGNDTPRESSSTGLPELRLPDRIARQRVRQARQDPVAEAPSAARVKSLLPERTTLESSSGQAREVGRNTFLPPPTGLPPVGGAPESSRQAGGARETPSANPASEHLSARGANGSTGQPPAALAARGDAVSGGSARSSGTWIDEYAELIHRVASNIATPADMDLFNHKLLSRELEIYQELRRWEVQYREGGQVEKADRLRGLVARVVLHSRSQPSDFLPKERGTDYPNQTPQKPEASKDETEAVALARAMAETIERVAYGTASKAQKRAFVYDLLISEDLFERVSRVQNLLAQEATKTDQDKAKRLAQVLHSCNERLLKMHQDAAAATDMASGPGLLGSSLSGGGAAGASRGSADADGSEQFEENPAREEASAPRQTSTLSKRAQTSVPLQPGAASQRSEDAFVRELRRRASIREAADAQRLPAGLADTLERTRLNDQQQGAREGTRAKGSRGQPKASCSTNPKKAKKGRCKK